MLFSEFEIDQLKMRADEAGFSVLRPGTQSISLSSEYNTLALLEPFLATEFRNLATRLASEKFDELRMAEIAGMLAGRIEITGAGAKEKARALEAVRRRSREDFRAQGLLVLQAQLDSLEKEYQVLDRDIQGILAGHLTDEELRGLELASRDDRAREEMRLMREKLARGELANAEFSEFEERWLERQAKAEEIAALTWVIEHGTDQDIARAIESRPVDHVRQARQNAPEGDPQYLEDALNRRFAEGSFDTANTDDQEMGVIHSGVILGDDDKGSVASRVMPDHSIGDAQHMLKSEFGSAVTLGAPLMQPDIQPTHSEQANLGRHLSESNMRNDPLG